MNRRIAVKEKEISIDTVNTIIGNYDADKAALISILHDVQAEYGYLPQELLKHIANELEIPLTQVFGVATFFKAFRLKPRGRHLIQVCLGTACYVRGGPRVLDEFQRRLKVNVGDTTEDHLFTLERVNCVGSCALGPVILVDNEYYGQMTPNKVVSLLKKYRS